MRDVDWLSCAKTIDFLLTSRYIFLSVDTHQHYDPEMTTSVSFPLRQSNPEALDYSQQASQFLQKYASTGTSKALVPFWSYPESTEIWLTHERLLLSCLRTGDNKSAFLALERLIDRFGATNERVMGLRGMYQEAVAEDDNALEKILKEYNDVLAENPVNTVRFPSSSRTLRMC